MRQDKKIKLGKNTRLFERAESLIPLCSQTFSKSYENFSKGVSPIFAEKADGCTLWDVDGNRYLDFAMGLCAVLLGYNVSEINRAILKQLERGISYTLPHRLEVELAERLERIFPCAEMVRYGKNGSDATAGAVRAARAFTGRDIIACSGYHGWQDWYIGTTSRNKGVPEATRKLTRTFQYNDAASLARIFEEHHGNVAAVILEPVGVEWPQSGFLESVRTLCDEHGAVLIFDEIITGFRLADGGAQKHFNVTPDLAAIGKSMANGMPISAVIGKKPIMKEFEKIFFSFTFGGEALSLAASLATLDFIERYRVIPFIQEQGDYLKEKLSHLITRSALKGFVSLKGYGARHVFQFEGGADFTDLELKTLFQQECHQRGLLFNGSHNMSFAHKKDVVNRALDIYAEVIDVTARILENNEIRKNIKGEVVQPVFRKA